MIDRSGTVTSGGNAQTIMSARPTRRGFELQNNSSGDLWFNVGVTAAASQPSYKLAPGQTYSSPVNDTPQALVSLYGATTGQAFTAKEW